jgi:acetyltransferase-like isoleucine patch superfamily enzyme
MSTKKPNILLSLLFWALPASNIKIRLLRLLGNSIGTGVQIGPTLVLSCGAFDLADDAEIHSFNVFRGMRKVRMGRNALITNFNWFSAAPVYQQYHEEAGTFDEGDCCIIMSRHYFDCSGHIKMEEFSAIGGHKTSLQTHEYDVVRNRPTIGTITIGAYSLVASQCLLLKGSRVPARSVVAAGSVMTNSEKYRDDTPSGLWGGSPARRLRDLPVEGWFVRTERDIAFESYDSLDFFDD